MQLLIGGADKTSLFSRQTLNIIDMINSRSTCSFTLMDPAGAYHPSVGEEVLIYDGALIFGGTIDEPEEIKPPGTSALEIPIQAVDWHEKADRRIVAEVYENQTAGAIVQDIITKYLADEGITVGTIQTGATIVKAVFNYIPVSQALDELSELTGYQWVIRADKSLDFFDRATFSAPWSITDNSAIMNVRVRRNREKYRNRQYIRAGKDISDAKTESFKGDGATRTFTVALPIAKVPTITKNSNPQTVGIGQVESGKQWYWNEGERTFYQDPNETVLGTSDTVEITYQGFFPIIVMANEETAQAERKSVEGGTGIYEAVEEIANVNTGEAAMEYAVLTFNTYEEGLNPGHLLPVELTPHNLSGEFLVSRVIMTDPGRADGKLLYSVEALDGEAVGGWPQFFRKLIQKGQTFVIRENEVLIRLVQFRDSVVCGDSMTVSSAAPESRIGYAMIGFSEIA